MTKYRKIGGGSLRIGKKIIKQNEVFEMEDWKIPIAFEDSIIEIEKPTRTRTRKTEPGKEQTQEPEKLAKTETTVTYTKQERETKGWFDVVGVDGKPVNDNALRETDANQLIEQLSE